MTKVSIAIPCYEMGGLGREILASNLAIIETQTFKDFDVVIADHSVNDEIEGLCDFWLDYLDINYYRNEEHRGFASANTDFSIRKSTGEFIKLLCQDDYFYDKDSLQRMVDGIGDKNWLASAYVHTYDKVNYFKYHLPRMNPNIHFVNTIGTPSCVMLRNVWMPKFDFTLRYAYDCDFYRRFYDMHGEPAILDSVNIVNYLWPNSVTSTIGEDAINNELKYTRQKYK